MSKHRARNILAVVHQLTGAIADLDALQAGDVDGKISPIKHRLRDAVTPIIEEIRAIAAEEYQKAE